MFRIMLKINYTAILESKGMCVDHAAKRKEDCGTKKWRERKDTEKKGNISKDSLSFSFGRGLWIFIFLLFLKFFYYF